MMRVVIEGNNPNAIAELTTELQNYTKEIRELAIGLDIPEIEELVFKNTDRTTRYSELQCTKQNCPRVKELLREC